MKKFVVLALTSLSTVAFGSCVLENQTHFDYSNQGYSRISFPVKIFSKFESLRHFDAVTCKDAVAKKVVTGPDGKSYQLIYTIEDYCDGGNSYGIVLDDSDKAVAEMSVRAYRAEDDVLGK